MVRIVFTFFVILVPVLTAGGENDHDADCLVFSYFTDNGQDGLHLAYSYDGLNFQPVNDGKSILAPKAGKDRLMRDPCVCIGPDGRFHMVWTVSWWDKGIGYASSKDLINWSKQKFIPVMAHEPAAKNCWAPEVFYDEATGKFLVFWATTIPGRFPETEKKGDNNHRIYFVETADFDKFTKAGLFYDHGFNVIDSTIVKDSDKYIMFLKDETRYPPQKNIRLAESKKAAGPYSAASQPITGDYWAEGPTAIKLGNVFYLYFDKYRKGRYGVLVSEDLKNWTDRSDELTYPKGMRHGTVFRVPEKILNGLLEHFAGK